MTQLKYFTLFLWVPFLFAKDLVVVGENYVLFQNENKTPVVKTGIEPLSWVFDKSACRLWVTSDKGLKLSSYRRGYLESEREFSGTLISEIENNQFFSLSSDFKKVHLWNSEGELVSELSHPGGAYLKRIGRLSSDNFWTLNQGARSGSKQDLWLSRLDEKGQVINELTVETRSELWGASKVILNESTGTLWLGYSMTTPQHTYSPQIKKISSHWTIEDSYQWKDRGLFFDSCLDREGNVWVARDIPTMPYTVPVYSFLEKLLESSVSHSGLDLDTNLLVDSMTCHEDAIYLAVRSILGGENKQILKWSKDSGKRPETVLRLPDKAQQIWVCY